MDVYETIPKSIATIMKDTYVYVKTDILEKPDIHFMVSKYAEFLGGYDDIACFSNEPIHVQTYIAEIDGEIKCNNEIKEAIWIDRNYKEEGIKVGSILGEHVIPKLIERGLM